MKSPGGGGGKLGGTRTRKNQLLLPATHQEASGSASARVQLEDSWQSPVLVVSSNSSEMQSAVVSHAAWHDDSVWPLADRSSLRPVHPVAIEE